jgi:phospholipid/cholesterol/gamma-HCH transport system substrate-binding protein
MRPAWRRGALRTVVAAVVVAAAATMLTACGGGSATTVTARFADAAGLFTGNDVGVLGVRVGEVSAITPKGDHVDVTLHINPGVKIPAAAGAVVVSRSVATDRYVELTPVYDSGPVLQSGAVLGENRTRSPVEFDELQASLQKITAQLAGPDGKATPVNDVLKISAKTLDGNGKTIAKGLKDLATALDATNTSSGDTVGTVKHLDTLTAALADNDRLVREFSKQVSDATGMLDDEHESLGATFDALAAMVRAVTRFARDHRGAIDDQVDDFTAIVGSLVDDRKRLAQLIETLPLMAQNVGRAIDDKGRLNFRTRPVDLLPGDAAFQVLCSNLPPKSCDGFKKGATILFDFLAKLAGVRTE